MWDKWGFHTDRRMNGIQTSGIRHVSKDYTVVSISLFLNPDQDGNLHSIWNHFAVVNSNKSVKVPLYRFTILHCTVSCAFCFADAIPKASYRHIRSLSVAVWAKAKKQVMSREKSLSVCPSMWTYTFPSFSTLQGFATWTNFELGKISGKSLIR